MSYKPACGSVFECNITPKAAEAFFVYYCGNCIGCFNVKNPPKFILRKIKPAEDPILKSTVPVSREVPYVHSFPSAMKQEETEAESIERRRFEPSSKNEKCSLKYPCLGRSGVHCSRKKPCQKHF